MITAAELRTRTVKDLATMARKKKVLGWHTMRKDELVQAIVKAAKLASKRNGVTSSFASNGNGAASNPNPRNGRDQRLRKRGQWPRGLQRGLRPTRPRRSRAVRQLERRLQQIKTRLAEAKDLSFKTVGQRRAPDQRPRGGHGPRSLLAACLLGTESEERRAVPKSPWDNTGMPHVRPFGSMNSAATERRTHPANRFATSRFTAA